MRILVTFAVRTEFSPWCSRHPFVPYEFENWEKRRQFDLFKANLGSDEVTVLLTGIGGDSAKHAVHTVPIALHDVCISTGLAGSLDPGLQPGEVAVARNLELLADRSKTPCDPQLVEIAVACGARAVETLLTSQKIIASAEEKLGLSAAGSAVEMESAHVLAAARQHHVPAVAVRGVSDGLDEDLPVDFARLLDSQGHLKMGGLFKELGLHPSRLGPLMKFAGQSRAAAVSLADFLDRYISAISSPGIRMPMLDNEEVSAT